MSESAGVSVKVRDTVGAGDAFTAAMTLGLLRGDHLDQINQRACEIAACVCSQPGATPPLPVELKQAFGATSMTDQTCNAPPALCAATVSDARGCVVYRDDRLLVLDKPSGLLAVPGRGPDLQDCLSARVQAAWPQALVIHRLDRDTSGLIVMAPTRRRSASSAGNSPNGRSRNATRRSCSAVRRQTPARSICRSVRISIVRRGIWSIRFTAGRRRPAGTSSSGSVTAVGWKCGR